jgi:3'-phosphoadenosine 5'-phosphosulfate sulfotransferase (PAPS reductase)/FAD synthetase
MRIICASYGNDSIALVQWAKDNRLTDVLVAHSDTGWAAEGWADRVVQAEAWVSSLGFTPVRIPSVGMADLVRRKKAWPRGGGGKFQFCTHELKEKPALEWMETIDPDKQAICMVGIRREESANRAMFPEWVESSEKHGGRTLHAPLVRLKEKERNALLAKTPFNPLPVRSKECWPCVNANKGELKLLDDRAIIRVKMLEDEMGINSKGNARVMFSPARHNEAVGIEAVVNDAKKGVDDLFGGGCDGGWCGS